MIAIGSIPVYAQRLFVDERGVFFDFRDEPAHEGHREHAPHPQGAAQAPRVEKHPQERRGSERPPGVPPGAAWLPVLLVFTLAVACRPPSGDHRTGIGPVRPLAALSIAPGSRPAGAAGDPSRRSGAAVPALLLDAQLADVAARLEALDLAAPLRFAAACKAGCLPGVAELSEQRDGGLRCSCRRLPSLPVVSVSSIDAKAARLQAADRHSQDVHQEPGADEDTRAGLSSLGDRG